MQTPDGTLESDYSFPLIPYQSLPSKKRPKAGELIELASFGMVEIENIERRGSGHEFLSAALDHPAWCDRCGDLIWCVGIGQLAQCSKCKFTCHTGCLQFITVDCQPQPAVAPKVEKVERSPSPLSLLNLSREEVMHLINKHNRYDAHLSRFTVLRHGESRFRFRDSVHTGHTSHRAFSLILFSLSPSLPPSLSLRLGLTRQTVSRLRDEPFPR